MTEFRPLVFFGVVLMLTLALHTYLGHRLISPAGFEPGTRRILWCVLTFATLCIPCTFLLLPLSGAVWADRLQWIGYVVMGFWSLALIFVMLRDVAWFSTLAVQKVLDHEWIPHDPKRRNALLSSLNVGAIGLTAGFGTAALIKGSHLASVVRVRVPIENLPESLKGFTIAQLTDLHVGPTIRSKHMKAVVDTVNSLEPDLIAVTGDLVDGSVEGLAPHVAPLGTMKARHGSWFVTGNHEYYSGADAWIQHIRDSLHMNVLLDEHQVLDHDGAQVVVAGVTDITAPRMHAHHHSDAKKAFSGAPPGDFRLFLAHQPESERGARDQGVHLQLSGHTHGGQYAPFTWLIHLVKPFIKGLYPHHGGWLYVNPGTTYWGPPLRLGAPQEITLLELTAASPRGPREA